MGKYEYNTRVFQRWRFTHIFSHIFKPYIQNQAFLIPPSFREFLSEDHEAVILSDLIGSLDLDSLYSSYSNHVRGTSAYDPAMLFKVLIYAYSHKMFSSRTIATRLCSDIALMYLSGNQKPDFRTINRFRKEKGKLLESVFVQIVEVARDIGLISFGTLSLDGTKIYANASVERNETLASLEKTIR
jgi:transposase